MDEIRLSSMTMADYPLVLALWEASEGVGLSAADEPEAISAFLARNPELSSVAYANDRYLVGAVLCGHDGRRGYIHHLATHPDFRHQGIGRRLVERCLAGLATAGIDKCHLFVFEDNRAARAFWQTIGWHQRVELIIMSTFVGQKERS